jgi:diketogulonate reductase-like aldo/keto reductase
VRAVAQAARYRPPRLLPFALAGSHPLEDTVAAFEQLRADGKILSWGVSNFDVDDLDEVHEIAGAGRLACNQVLYHLGERAIEHAVIPWCEENGVAIVAYSPFGHAGGFPEPHSPGGRVLKAIADRHNFTPRQVALRFLTRRASLFAIPKASNPEHARENAGAATLHLSAAELAKVDGAFPLGARPHSLPML